MATLEDIIKLSEVDGGKFFIMNEKGDAKLVIMSVEDYQSLLVGKLQNQIIDAEKINQEILKAQLSEQKAAKAEETISPPKAVTGIPRVDLRQEVIDPSFDFDSPSEDNLEI